MIGDVTGHGVPSAMITAAAKASCDVARHVHNDDVTVTRLLEIMNHAIFESAQRRFVMTCFASIVDTKARTITYANAGHNFPYLFRPARASGEFGSLMIRGNRLGDDRSSKYEAKTTELVAGDVLVWYTDGIVECENEGGEEYGEKRFRASRPPGRRARCRRDARRGRRGRDRRSSARPRARMTSRWSSGGSIDRRAWRARGRTCGLALAIAVTAAAAIRAHARASRAEAEDDLRDGDKYFEQGDWKRAADRVRPRDRARRPSQVPAAAYGKRAAIYIILKDYPGGPGVHRARRRARYPNAPEVMEQEALILWQTGKRDEAIEIAEKVVEDPAADVREPEDHRRVLLGARSS